MKLFVIKSRGSYSLNVAVVCADTPVQALAMADVDGDPWETHEVSELPDPTTVYARQGVVFETGYIE